MLVRGGPVAVQANDLRDVKAPLYDLNDDNDPGDAVRDVLRLLARRLPEILQEKKALLEILTTNDIADGIDQREREDREQQRFASMKPR